jgi:hypothetical protein
VWVAKLCILVVVFAGVFDLEIAAANSFNAFTEFPTAMAFIVCVATTTTSTDHKKMATAQNGMYE